MRYPNEVEWPPTSQGMTNEPSARVSVRPSPGNVKVDDPMVSTTTSSSATKTKASIKGTFNRNSEDVSKVLKDPNVLKDPKVLKDSLKDMPKDPKVSQSPINKTLSKSKSIHKFNDKGVCVRCKSDQLTTESICCNLCNDRFHACCRERNGVVSNTAICPPSSHRLLMPLITKYGNKNADRWGNFMFMCNSCAKKVRSLNGNTAKLTTNASSDTSDLDETSTAQSDTSTDTSDLACNTTFTSTESKAANSSPEICDLTNALGHFKAELMASVKELVSSELKSSKESLLTTWSNSNCITQRSSTPSTSSSISGPYSLSSSSESSLTPVHSASSLLSSNVTGVSNINVSAESASEPAPSTPATHGHVDSFIDFARMSSPTIPTHSSSPNSTNLDATVDHVLVLNVDTKAINLVEVEKIAGDALKKVPLNSLIPKPRTGKVILSFPSEQDRDEGRKSLESLPAVNEFKISINEAKKMFPKVTVTNIPNNLISHIIAEKLSVSEFREKVKSFIEARFLDKNQEVKELVTQNRTFKVIFVKCGKDYTTVGIKVSPDIRHILIRNQYIHIGYSRCKVVDRFDMRQCFRCQKFGHMSHQCRETAVVCMYCSASHISRSCPYKDDKAKHRCTNCSHSTDETLRNTCHTHHSGSEDCPIMKQEVDNLRCRTEYSKNM